MAGGDLLRVSGLDVCYNVYDERLKALHDVSFSVGQGEIVGIVGESGCGKSTLSSALLRLLPDNAEVMAGSIELAGHDLLHLSADAVRPLRGSEIAMIYQDPQTSLNPVFSIATQMVDAQRAHAARREVAMLAGRAADDQVALDQTPVNPLRARRARRSSQEGSSKRSFRQRAIAVLEQVGIPDAAERIDDLPHEFSGGQRQRIMIATTLLLRPSLLIADEPTSSLDVTLEAQILSLLQRLREDHGTSILFISHDLAVVSQLCDRVIVMYAGRIVEQADVATLFDTPQHPYTRALLASIPSRHRRGGRLAGISGRVPSLARMPAGCKFADRCKYVVDVCRSAEPELYPVNGQISRCYMYDPVNRDHFADPPADDVADGDGAALPAVPMRAARRFEEAAGGGPLIQTKDLSTHFAQPFGLTQRFLRRLPAVVRAVDDVSIEINRGEIIGLVGESGSGKTTLGRSILQLVETDEGEIEFDGQDVLAWRKRELRAYRRRAQMIFQDPHASLSPRLKVASLLREPYVINKIPKDVQYSVDELLALVGLSVEQADKYPYQLSGGQARRVGIARALALQPDFIVADEPTSGLDVSAAASVLNLMKDLRDQLGLTYLIITHNLNVLGYIANRIAVMYLGRVVEIGPSDRILDSPLHPYTQALLASTPEPDPHARKLHHLLAPGEIPSPTNPPPGCRFHTRCAFATDQSRAVVPELEQVSPGHFVACHNWRLVPVPAEIAPQRALQGTAAGEPAP